MSGNYSICYLGLDHISVLVCHPEAPPLRVWQQGGEWHTAIIEPVDGDFKLCRTCRGAGTTETDALISLCPGCGGRGEVSHGI